MRHEECVAANFQYAAGVIFGKQHCTGAIGAYFADGLWIAIPVINFEPAVIYFKRRCTCAHAAIFPFAGAGEQAYSRREDAPEITFVNRDAIDRADEAYV